MLAEIHGLKCASGDLTGCNAQAGDCDARGGVYLGVEWPGCPVRSIMCDKRIQAVLHLDGAHRVAPLSGWPDGFAAWVPEMLGALSGLRESRKMHAKDQQGVRSGR